MHTKFHSKKMTGLIYGISINFLKQLCLCFTETSSTLCQVYKSEEKVVNKLIGSAEQYLERLHDTIFQIQNVFVKMILLYYPWSGVGTGCPRRWWSHHPQRCFKNV